MVEDVSLSAVGLARQMERVVGPVDRLVGSSSVWSNALRMVVVGFGDDLDHLTALPDGRVMGSKWGCLYSIHPDSGEVDEFRTNGLPIVSGLSDGRLVVAVTSTSDVRVSIWDLDSRRFGEAVVFGEPCYVVGVDEGQHRIVLRMKDSIDRVLEYGSGLELRAVHTTDETSTTWALSRELDAGQGPLLLPGDLTIDWNDAAFACAFNADGSHVGCLHGPGGGFGLVSRGGLRFAAASTRGAVTFWDVNGDQPFGPSCDHAMRPLGVKHLVPRRDGTIVTSDHGSTSLWLWELGDVCRPVRIGDCSDEVDTLLGLTDGRVVAGCLDGSIWIWDVFRSRHVEISRAHDESLVDLALLGDGRFVSIGYDDTLRVWSPDGESQAVIRHPLLSGVEHVGGMSNGRIVTGSDELVVWDLDNLDDPCRVDSFQKTPWLVQVVGEDGILVVDLSWNASFYGFVEEAGRGPRYLEDMSIGSGPVVDLGAGVVLSVDGQQMYAVDLSSGEECFRIDATKLGMGDISDIATSPDGSLLVASHGSDFCVWDISLPCSSSS